MSNLVSLIFEACTKDAAAVHVCDSIGTMVSETEAGRSRVALALRQTASLIMSNGVADIELSAKGTPLSVLLNLSIDLSKRNQCVINAPFVVIEDLLMSRTVNELSAVFDLVEHYVGVMAESKLLQSQRAKLALLRLCNSLLERLPRTQDMAFRGRVLILLAKCFPIDERSGVNLKGAFNVSNTTVMDTEFPKDGAPNFDFAFYRTFWSLQSYLSNPRQLIEDSNQSDFIRIVDAVIVAFEGTPLHALDVDAAFNSDDANDSGFNAKFLTTPRLFALQLRDPLLRRTVLLQLMIIFNLLLKQPSSSKVPISVSYQHRLEMLALSERVTKVMGSTPPEGQQFLNAVKIHLSGEALWSSWKDSGCPPIENQNIVRNFAGEKLDIISPKLVDMGDPVLNKLWSIDTCLSDPARLFRSSVHHILEEVREEDEPDADIEDAFKKKNDVKWSWKALRLLIREDLQLVSEFEGDLGKMAHQPAFTTPAVPARPASPAIAPEVNGPPEVGSPPNFPEPSRSVSHRPLIKRRLSTVPVEASPSIPEAAEDGAIDDIPTKRIRTATMNEQLMEQIALEKAKKQQQDDEIRARRASRFDRKSDPPSSNRR